MARVCKTVTHPSELSPYHRRICELLSSGYTNQEIADVVGSSRNAIRVMVARIVHSTGSRNSMQMVAWFSSNRVPTSTHMTPESAIRLTV